MEGEPRPLQERLEAPVNDVLGVYRAAHRSSEHEAVVLPPGAHPELLLKLTLAMLAERSDGAGWKAHGAAAGVLRLGEFKVARPVAVPAHAL